MDRDPVESATIKSPTLARAIHPAILTIQPSISPVPHIILDQSLNLCYRSLQSLILRLDRPCFFFPGRFRSKIPTPSGPGPKVPAIHPPFMCALCTPCAAPGHPRSLVPQRIPTPRPPIRVTVRAIPNAQHRGTSGLTPLFATLPENPPVSLIIATLP